MTDTVSHDATPTNPCHLCSYWGQNWYQRAENVGYCGNEESLFFCQVTKPFGSCLDFKEEQGE